MKRILLIIGIIGNFAMFNSCQDDFMKFDPSDSVDAEGAITNIQQMENAILGIYAGVQHQHVYGNHLITAQEILSDNGYVTLRNSNRFTDYNTYTHAISEGGTTRALWTRMYRVIARVNYVIEHESLISDPSVPSMMAEAKAIRALMLFNLVNYYARPYGSFDQSLGIPIPYKFAIGEALERKSVDEVYAQVIDDLTYAAEHINQVHKGRITKPAIHALLSRVYLFQKQYPKVVEHANLALTQTPDTYVKGENLLDYYVNPLNYKETLFAVVYSSLDKLGANDAIGATWTRGGRYDQNVASSVLYDLIENNDARKNLYILKRGVADVRPYNVLKFGADDNDNIVLRASEIFFNKIEAMYYTNQSEALAELNQWVKNNRNDQYSFSESGQVLLDEIYRQRRIELAFEGHRLFDLNRLGLDVIKNPANVNQNPIVPFNDFKRVFPIPINEMNTNPKMIQNPKYQ